MSGDTLDPPVSVRMVDSGPVPPEPEFVDNLRLPDFSSDIDPGPGKPFPESGCISAWSVFIGALELGPGRPSLESGGIPDKPSFVDDLDTGSGKSFPQYGRALWVQGLLGASGDEPDALLQDSGARLHVISLVVCILGPECPGWSQLAGRKCRTLLVPLIRVPIGPFRSRVIS